MNRAHLLLGYSIGETVRRAKLMDLIDRAQRAEELTWWRGSFRARR